MTTITLLGPPGSGKSTQAHLLSYALHLTRISTGDVLRELVTQAETRTHKQVAYFMQKGLLVPDEIVMPIITEYLRTFHNFSPGFILDGIPRNLEQVSILDATLKDLGTSISKAFYLHATPDNIRERIARRLLCKICQAPGAYSGSFVKCAFCGGELSRRKDDLSQVVSERMTVYAKQTQPLIHEYERSGRLIYVDTNEPIHMVLAKIINALSPRLFFEEFLSP